MHILSATYFVFSIIMVVNASPIPSRTTFNVSPLSNTNSKGPIPGSTEEAPDPGSPFTEFMPEYPVLRIPPSLLPTVPPGLNIPPL
ncbi:hypothetical protein C8R45DRAFT_382899 [Mycena sanguinolenta]|nr:hypothetical protein C8R45DRAFT_382899 [Mycena sanguinolenta]